MIRTGGAPRTSRANGRFEARATTASNARLIRALSHVCGQVETEVNCWRKEISAYVPRQTRRWGSGGRGFKSRLPDQTEPISAKQLGRTILTHPTSVSTLIPRLGHTKHDLAV
jgi:hypothetical protein